MSPVWRHAEFRALRRLLPRSLFARLMLIWLLGMALVLAVSLALFVSERQRIGRSALFEGVAQEIATAADLLDRMSPPERERWIDDIGRRRLRLALLPPREHLRPLAGDHPLQAALREAMPQRAATLYTHPRDDRPHPMLVIVLPLADGAPLQVRLPGIAPMPGLMAHRGGPFFAALAALVLGVGLLTWLAVRIATRPLSRLAAAARALGEDPGRAPMDTAGPTEVAQAAAAFNQMQARIAEHVTERTRILAAISHDLQTPITRLRLRAEQVDDDELRTRIQSDLDAMQGLVREGLAYARSLDERNPPQAIELGPLLQALAQDAQDMGWTVRVPASAPGRVVGQPAALRRALWNLIENGVKFGGEVDITLAPRADGVEIRIRDHGPGLADEELEKVFEPFYRTESSRNRETGGTGLGLAITRNLLRGQNGEVSLRNHPEGGLVASVVLRGR